MIEHHRRVIGKPGIYREGDQLSITRAPITDFTLWNDELKEGRDFKLNPDQGVIIFLKDTEVESWIGVEFRWNSPEERKVEKRPWWKRIFRKAS